MDLIVARAIHVLAVVVWIGGVGFVTTVVFPSFRARAPLERLAGFVRFEERFAFQARITVALAGLSGLYMVAKLDLWARFASSHFWWMHAMLGLWLAFAAMLFVLEPLVLRRRLHRAIDGPDGPRLFARMERLHQVLFALAAITILGATAGAHGL